METEEPGVLPLKRRSSFQLPPPDFCELRLVLLGNSWSLKALVGNILLGKTEFTEHNKCVKGSGTLKDKPLTVIYSPDQLLTSSSQEELKQFIEDIKDLSAPGPHVFLLVLQPEAFTEQHKTRLESVLESLSEQAFDHSLVLMFRPLEETTESMEKYISETHIKDLIIRCRYRYMQMYHPFLNQYDLNLEEFKRKELFSRIGDMLKENNGDQGQILAFSTTEKPSLNQNQMKVVRAEIDLRREMEMNNLEDKINLERELRNFEQKSRETEDRLRKKQEEKERQLWKQRVEELEAKIKLELQSKQTIDKQLEISREELKNQQKAWEREKEEWWETRVSESTRIMEQESIRMSNLQQEINRKKKEDQIRQEQEEKQRQELMKTHQEELAKLKLKHEQDARSEAEKFNEFKEKYSRDFDALLERHCDEISALKEQHEKEIVNIQEQHATRYNLLQNLLSSNVESTKAELEFIKKQLQDEITKAKLTNQHKKKNRSKKKGPCLIN